MCKLLIKHIIFIQIHIRYEIPFMKHNKINNLYDDFIQISNHPTLGIYLTTDKGKNN